MYDFMYYHSGCPWMKSRGQIKKCWGEWCKSKLNVAILFANPSWWLCHVMSQSLLNRYEGRRDEQSWSAWMGDRTEDEGRALTSRPAFCWGCLFQERFVKYMIQEKFVPSSKSSLTVFEIPFVLKQKKGTKKINKNQTAVETMKTHPQDHILR